jgi:hypothetical protein
MKPKVAVLGAAGGIGQPLSLLLKSSNLVGELVLFDVANTAGVAADLSHISTPVKVSAFTGNDQLTSALKGCQLVVIPAGGGHSARHVSTWMQPATCSRPMHPCGGSLSGSGGSGSISPPGSTSLRGLPAGKRLDQPTDCLLQTSSSSKHTCSSAAQVWGGCVRRTTPAMHAGTQVGPPTQPAADTPLGRAPAPCRPVLLPTHPPTHPPTCRPQPAVNQRLQQQQQQQWPNN